jgi:transcriptional regulator with XRE-family HTH domain
MGDALGDALQRARTRRSLPAPGMRRTLRQRAGISQTDLARALGVDRATVSRWESGDRQPDDGFLQAYLEALDRLAREAV